MKNTFSWILAALLICGLTVSSCKKEPAEKKTVLAGMSATGVPMYDSVTYTYEYDANYRIVRVEAHQTNGGYVVKDVRFTYSDNSIKVEGSIDSSPGTIVCTLDSEGRITHMDDTRIGDSVTSITHYDFTYDAEGHLLTEYRISDNEESEGATRKYEWEGDELKATDLGDGALRTTFEASAAPAQALYLLIGYDLKLYELCAQGCFGKTPAHMPSKSAMVTAISIPGMPAIEYDYTYTVDAEGRLATCVENGTVRNVQYTLNWEER